MAVHVSPSFQICCVIVKVRYARITTEVSTRYLKNLSCETSEMNGNRSVETQSKYDWIK